MRFVLKSCDNRAVGRHGIRQPGAPLPSRGRASAGATTGSPRHQGSRGTRDDVTMGRPRCVPEGSRRLSLSPATRFSQNDNRARRNATDALCPMPYLILVGTRSGSEPTPPMSRAPTREATLRTLLFTHWRRQRVVSAPRHQCPRPGVGGRGGDVAQISLDARGGRELLRHLGRTHVCTVPMLRRPRRSLTSPPRRPFPLQRLIAGSLTGALCIALWGAWMLLIGVRPCVTASLLWR